MKRTLFLMSFGIGAILLAANHANAQIGDCGTHETMVTRLAEHYGEISLYTGLGYNNAVVEVFASPDTGSWTITVTEPGGSTCLVAAGQAFQQLSESLPNFSSGV